MSNKILFVIAGPRLKGASAFAARTAAEGAGQAGADVEIVELPKLTHIQSMGCISCMRCQISREYRCALNDDLARLVARFPEFDVIVFSTPVFFFSMPAQIKGLSRQQCRRSSCDSTGKRPARVDRHLRRRPGRQRRSDHLRRFPLLSGIRKPQAAQISLLRQHPRRSRQIRRRFPGKSPGTQLWTYPRPLAGISPLPAEGEIPAQETCTRRKLNSSFIHDRLFCAMARIGGRNSISSGSF